MAHKMTQMLDRDLRQTLEQLIFSVYVISDPEHVDGDFTLKYRNDSPLGVLLDRLTSLTSAGVDSETVVRELAGFANDLSLDALWQAWGDEAFADESQAWRPHSPRRRT